MAEEDDAGGPELDEEGLEQPRKGKKLLLVLVLLVVLLGAAGAGLYFSGMLGDLTGGESVAEEVEEAEESSGGHGEEGKGENAGPVFHTLPEFIVNLNTAGTNAGTSFMKVTVVLDLPSEEALKKVVAMEPRIIDDFNTYLRELRASDLAGSAGVYRLREELLMRTNKILHPQQVNDILFKEMLVQ